MRSIITLLSIILTFGSAAQDISINLSGNIFNSNQDSIFVSQYYGTGYKNFFGTKIKKDGTFKMKGALPHPDFYVLRFGNEHINIILRDKSDFQVYSDGSNISAFTNIVGSEESVNLNKYLNIAQAWKLKLDSANARVAKFPEERPEINREMTKEYKKFQGLRSSFIQNNSNSAALFGVLNTLDINTDFATYEAVMRQLMASFGLAPTVIAANENFQKYKTEKLENDPLAPGKMAPTFTEVMANGDSLSLEDLRGKVVLLDFWASWCGPCRRENPNVVNLYEKYKDDGFTIMSVSLDKTKAPWLAAIEKDNLSWPNHVSDLNGWNSRVPKFYGVRGIPFTVLIDREGNIITSGNATRGEALAENLARIFGH